MYDELVEMALLLNNETDSLDIKEVHLSSRRLPLPPIECGMPTLRKFIRPTDWHRVETMIDIVMDLHRRSCSNDITFGIQCSCDFQVNLGATFGPDKLLSLWPTRMS